MVTITQLATATQPMILYKNIFQMNSGFIESDSFHIRKLSLSVYDPILNQTASTCGGVFIRGIYLEANIGCSLTIEGSLFAQCVLINSTSPFVSNIPIFDKQV
jgi:hypothetical protein